MSRDININQGDYIENIGGNYIQQSTSITSIDSDTIYQEKINDLSPDFDSVEIEIQPTTKVLMVGGYARSGKSTVIDYLEESYSVPVFSGSRMVNDMANSLTEFKGFKVNRLTKIFLAEQYLKRYLHPHLFSLAIADLIKESDHDIIIVESIGGAEEEDLLKRLGGDYSIYKWNIRRNLEEPSVDGRELLKNAEIIDNNKTLEDLHHLVRQEFKVIRGDS